jgi:hypothetical protein
VTGPRADASVMEPDRTPAAPHRAPAGIPSRLLEMAQLLEAFERARSAGRVDTRARKFDGDPVALTQAMYPRGLRAPRRSGDPPTQRTQAGMRMRIFVYDGTART